MEILIRAARILDKNSTLHNTVKDILIADGVIKKIGQKLFASPAAKIIETKNLHVSLGWFDMNSFLADPGYEQKETIESGCRAAAFGGFTHICTMPNTNPVTQTKAQVEYVLRKSAGEIVSVHPVGALTENCDGENLSEMYDLHCAGAIAFSDGLKTSPNAGVVERALLYVKAFNGLVMIHPEEKSIAKNGVMNEGGTSTRLGLPAMPALAEEISVSRDLYLLEYTDSKLHFNDISLKNSIELLREAKKKRLKVSASVNAYNLLLDETAVKNYNTNYKVNPPLRTKDDVAALARGIADGTIDTITSAHNPQDEECKKLEFDKADFGMIGLETCFAVAKTALKGKVSTEKIIELLTSNPRKILGFTQKIKEGEVADLTLFDPDLNWTFSESSIKSKSKNTPFIGTKFTGKALGVINKGKIQINP